MERGWDIKQDNRGKFYHEEQTDEVWINSNRTAIPVCSLSTLQWHWQKYFPKLYIRKHTKDICGICFKLKIHHKARNKVLNQRNYCEETNENDNEQWMKMVMKLKLMKSNLMKNELMQIMTVIYQPSKE
jgi:hypothetical protein